MRILRGLGTVVAALALNACVRTSVMPLSANTFELTASGAPVCHTAGTQSVAIRDAAIETIRRGYDLFIIQGAQQQDEPVGVIESPVTANTYGTATVVGGENFASSYGASTTTYGGGSSLLVRLHKQEIVVQMFHPGDAGAENAISARQLLGPRWQSVVAGGFKNSCL